MHHLNCDKEKESLSSLLDSDIMAGIKIYWLDNEEYLHLYFSIDIYAYVLYM